MTIKLITVIVLSLIAVGSGQRGQPQIQADLMSDPPLDIESSATDVMVDTLMSSSPVQPSPAIPITSPTTENVPIYGPARAPEDQATSGPSEIREILPAVPTMADQMVAESQDQPPEPQPTEGPILISLKVPADKDQAEQDLRPKQKQIIIAQERGSKWHSKQVRYRKLPIRAPKLRPAIITAASDSKHSRRALAKKLMLAYGLRNVDRTTTTTTTTTTTPAPSTTISAVVGEDKNENSPSSPVASRRSDEPDMFELSSSETQQATVHHHRSRPGLWRPRLSLTQTSSGRYRVVRNLTLPGPGKDGSQLIPKLLLPKANRPRMYSLDGYIPKPNKNRISTTSTLAPPSFAPKARPEKTVQALDEMAMSSSKRRKFGSRGGRRGTALDDLSSELNDLSAADTSNRRRVSSFSKRKGFVPTQADQQSPSTTNSVQDRKTGVAGRDFPTHHQIPKTTFECGEKGRRSGVFADLEAGCQVWHMCQGIRKHSFLCPNGTIFSEKAGVCDWWYNVECTSRTASIGSASTKLTPKVTTLVHKEPLMSLSSQEEPLTIDEKRKRLVQKTQPKPISNFAHLIDFEALLLKSG